MALTTAPPALPTKPHQHSITTKPGFFSSQIIAILAAILFPVFAKAREKARQSSCLSNVKQLTLAMLQYVGDYDEMFPGHRFLLNAGYGYWYQVIEPYIKNPQVFRCPSYSGSNAISYGYNGYGTSGSNGLGWRYASSGGPIPSQWPPTLAQIQTPAQMIMLGDHSDSTGDMRGYGNVGDSQLPTARHNEGANLSFVDGHAKWLKDSDYTPNAPAGWTLAGYPGLDRQWNMWVRNPSSSTGY